MNAAVFLDRDNTIIHNDGDLGDPSKVLLIQGAASAIASVRGLGYKIVVVTNQGGVARGKYGEDDVCKVHERIDELIYQNSNVKIDRFYYCPYHPKGTVDAYRREHPWRKPQPGMLKQAAKDLGLDLNRSWMIGDQLRDCQAGALAGVRTILITPDAKARPPLKTKLHAVSDSENFQPDYTAPSLIEAVRIIAQQRRPDQFDGSWDAPDDHLIKSPSAGVATPHQSSQGKAFRPWDAPQIANLIPERTANNSPLNIPRNAGDSSNEKIEDRASGNVNTDVSEAINADKSENKKSLASMPLASTKAPKAPTTATATVTTAPTAKAATTRPSTVEVVADESLSGSPSINDSRHNNNDVPVPTAVELPMTSENLHTGEMTSGNVLLRQILQELRTSQARQMEFSYLRMFAVVLQMIALVCLLGGLWFGQDAALDIIRWLGTAIVFQLATIVAVLFDRR